MKQSTLKKTYKGKITCKKGFTLIELLATTLILVLIASSLAVGIPAALNAYEKVTATAEATALLSTLSQSLTDELRYATDIKVLSKNDPALTSFTSTVYGRGIRPSNADDGTPQDGKIQMVSTLMLPGAEVPTTTTYPLLSESVYTRSLKSRILNNTITYSNNVFSLTLQIYLPANTINTINEEAVLAETELKVRAINN